MSPLHHERLPSRFGPYVLVSLLGEGGMARVFRAVREGPMGFRKELAIKRIREDLTRENDQLVRALINEARLGGQLKHANVVDTYEFGVVEGQHYIAMEFVNGLTLRSLIAGARRRGVRLPRGAVLDLAVQTCKGLEYAHDLSGPDGEPLGLVHRDLKPGNIIISAEGVSKIMDFGIARSATALYQTTATNVTKGTLTFMSPEQLGDARNLDHRSDLFAMGGILFEALTSVVLQSGPTPQAIMWSIVSGDYLPRLALLDEVFPEARPILERCLQLEREDRYEGAGELATDLQALREELGTSLGCSEMMGLLTALTREEDQRFESVGQLILDRQSKAHADTGWRAFIDSLPGDRTESRDPFRAGIHPPLDTLTLERPVLEPGEEVGALAPTTGGRVTQVAAPTRVEWTKLDGPAERTAPMTGSGSASAAVSADWAPAGATKAIVGTHMPEADAVFAPPRRRWPLIVGVCGALALVVGGTLALWQPWRSAPEPEPADADGAAAVAEPAPAFEAIETATEPEQEEPTLAPGPEPTPTPPVAEEEGPAPALPDVPPDHRTIEEAAPTAAPRVSVVINSYPWATWRISGDGTGQGESTPYVGDLEPGTYRFHLHERGAAERKTLTVTITGDEEQITRCWNFQTGEPC